MLSFDQCSLLVYFQKSTGKCKEFGYKTSTVSMKNSTPFCIVIKKKLLLNHYKTNHSKRREVFHERTLTFVRKTDNRKLQGSNEGAIIYRGKRLKIVRIVAMNVQQSLINCTVY